MHNYPKLLVEINFYTGLQFVCVCVCVCVDLLAGKGTCNIHRITQPLLVAMATTAVPLSPLEGSNVGSHA